MGEKKVHLLIPKDPQNEQYNVVRFQRDGIDFCVIRGEDMMVPEWVKEAAKQAGYI